MNFNTILDFIYNLSEREIKFWIFENNIKLFVPETVYLTEKDKQFLMFNKNEIMELLNRNQIFLKENDLFMFKTDYQNVPLSFGQQGIKFIDRHEGGSNAFNVFMFFKILGSTKMDILENSIRDMISRHEILRTLIKEDSKGNYYQHVLDNHDYKFEIQKIKVTDQEKLEEELKKESHYVYNLSDEILIKVYSLETNDQEKYLSVVIHHIAFDGWSMDIFLKELKELYRNNLAISRGLESTLALPKLTIQYKDFAIWQRCYLSGKRLDSQLGYWKNKLANYNSLNIIPDKERPKQLSYEGANIYFELNKELSIGLKEFAQDLKVSLYSLLLSGYYLMLRSYSKQDDIVIGTPIANRNYSQIQELIGFFINTLVLRKEIDNKNLVKDFIQEVGREIIEAQSYQELPFEKIVKEIASLKDTSKHPIFQVMFSLQNFGNNLSEDLDDFIIPYQPKNEIYSPAKCDFSFYIDDSKDYLKGVVNYSVNLYEEKTIRNFIETYVHILTQFCLIHKNKDKKDSLKISDLSYLNDVQQRKIIYEWNNTDIDFLIIKHYSNYLKSK